MIGDEGQWKILTIHNGVNIINNPILVAAKESLTLFAGVGVSGGVLGTLILCRLFRRRRRARNLLTGLVYCGVCGARLTSVDRDYLGCDGAQNSGNCGNRRSIRRPLLEHLILDALESRLMHLDAVGKFISEFDRKFNRLAREAEFGCEARAKELKDVLR